MSFWELINVLWRRPWMVAAITMAWTMLGVAAAFLMTPIYRAETVLMVAADDSDMTGGLASEFGVLRDIVGLRGDDAGREGIATLKSRALANRFLQDERLLPVLFEDLWDPEKKAWLGDDADNVPTLWDAYEKFSKEVLSVDENKRTGLVTVRIEWTDPVRAAQWANGLVRKANELLRQRALERASRNIEYLQRELTRTSLVELQQALSRLLEHQMKQLMLAKGNEEYAFKVIDEAVPPQERSRPKRALFILIAAVLGVTCSALMLWVRESLRRANPGNT